MFQRVADSMSTTTGVAAIYLPLITPRHVPKRYEETRPVLIQGCAHNRIIGMKSTCSPH